MRRLFSVRQLSLTALQSRLSKSHNINIQKLIREQAYLDVIFSERTTEIVLF